MKGRLGEKSGGIEEEKGQKKEKRMGVWGITRGEACKIVPLLAGPNPR